jgi:hypothetical protein
MPDEQTRRELPNYDHSSAMQQYMLAPGFLHVFAQSTKGLAYINKMSMIRETHLDRPHRRYSSLRRHYEI